MEDAHTTLLRLDTEDSKHVSFFAVFDGHGGSNAAKYSGIHVHQNVLATDEFKKGDYRKALKAGFIVTDENLKTGIDF